MVSRKTRKKMLLYNEGKKKKVFFPYLRSSFVKKASVELIDDSLSSASTWPLLGPKSGSLESCGATEALYSTAFFKVYLQ